MTWLSATPAHACSCSQEPLETMVDFYDGGFIGEATEYTDGYYHFQVEEWVSGIEHTDLVQAEFVLVEGDRGTSCDFGARIGATVAVFFNRADDYLRSDSCGMADVDWVRTSITPIAVDPDAGPGTTLIAENAASNHLWLLDAQGGLVSAAARPVDLSPWAELQSVVQCPGGSLVVESWWNDPQLLVVRDLSTMEIVRTVEISDDDGGELDSIACLDDAATELVAALVVDQQWTLIDTGDDGRLIASIDAADSVFVLAKIAPIQRTAVHLSQAGLQFIDLSTGDVTVVDALESLVPDLMYDPYAVGQLSPDGKNLAVYFNEISVDGGPVGRVLLMADVEAGTVTTQALIGPGSDDTIWLGSNEVVLGSPTADDALVVELATGTVSEDGPVLGRNSYRNNLRNQQSPDHFIATTTGAVISIDRATGEHIELIRIPATIWSQIVQLDNPVAVTVQVEPRQAPFIEERLAALAAQAAATPTADEAPNDDNQVEQAAMTEPESAMPGDGTSTALVVAVALGIGAVLALGFAALRARFR